MRKKAQNGPHIYTIFKQANSEQMKAKTRQEIAKEFGISRRTLYRWLKAENITLRSRLVSPDEQIIIYKNIGFPEELVLKKREL